MPQNQAWYRSDHWPLAERGVPALFAVGGPGRQPTEEDIANFTSFLQDRYHKPADELDDSWDFGGILLDARLFHALGRALADDPLRPSWTTEPPSVGG